MKYIVTLVLSLCIAFSAIADNKVKIGSLPLKSGHVMVVEEYINKAHLGQKVIVASDFCDVFTFSAGLVTKVLKIDNKYSVFIKTGNRYYVYNELKAVAVREGERLMKGEFIGELKYNSRYDEHQLEMQIWQDNGRSTKRCCNDEVVCVLRGVKYTPPAKKAVAKKTTKKKTYSRKKKTYTKKSTAKKKSSKYKKPVAKKKATAKKKKK